MNKLAVGILVSGLAVSLAGLAGADGQPVVAGSGAAGVERITQDLPYHGNNGFAALYTLGKDVPGALREQVVADDVRRYNHVLADASNAPDYAWDSRLDDYATLPAKGHGEDGWCRRGASCLDLVREDIPRTARIVNKSGKALEQAEALAQYDHFHSPFKPHPSFRVPIYSALFGPLTQNALRFVQGDTQQALEGVCSSVITGHRLLSGGDILVGSMIGASLVDQNSALLARMMAEMPAGEPIPATCKQAFAARMDTKDHVCRGMISEGKMALGGMLDQGMEHGPKHALDAKRTAALMAPDYTWYCSSEIAKRIDQGLPVNKGLRDGPHEGATCRGNEVGCVLANMALPRYYNYAMRMQDAAAAHAVAGELIKFHERGQTSKDLIALNPFLSGHRGVEVDEREVKIRLFKGEDDKATWAAPLPGSRVDGGR